MKNLYKILYKLVWNKKCHFETSNLLFNTFEEFNAFVSKKNKINLLIKMFCNLPQYFRVHVSDFHNI